MQPGYDHGYYFIQTLHGGSPGLARQRAEHLSDRSGSGVATIAASALSRAARATIGVPSRATSARKSPTSRAVIVPGRPSPIVRPSTRVTAASSPIVPVQNISSRAVDLGQRQVADLVRDAVRGAELEHRCARDALGAGHGARRAHPPAIDDEHVRRVGLRDEAAHVEHQRIVGAGDVGLDLRQDRLDQVVVMDLGVEAIGRKAPHAGGDQRDAVAAGTPAACAPRAR